MVLRTGIKAAHQHAVAWGQRLRAFWGRIPARSLANRLLRGNVLGDHRHSDRDEIDDSAMTGATRIIWLAAGFITVFLIWSYFATVDEVSSGQGTVIPHTRSQVIQSLEGGILQALYVFEGDTVSPGQPLARLDPTRSESDLEETEARYRGALARASRLEAEVNREPLTFPDELLDHPALIASESALYESRQQGLEQSRQGLAESLDMVQQERRITERLVSGGAASQVELLQLRRQEADLTRQLHELESEFLVRAREEMARASTEVEALASVLRGLRDAVQRQTLRSPVRGVVKSIHVTTLGGVLPANGQLMEIVPIEDQLRIEARISPRDIAFIRPGQDAKVKVTAYDYATYGALDGQVVSISPDTIRDEVNPEVFYYRVFIETESDALINRAGRRFPIEPGMIAQVDIRSGRKTVWQYLTKPLNRAGEALRER
ncbi:protein secretion ABC efflux system, membrane fusion protein [Thioalkalivibrio nitratireducens DSM 14787]|uniref:Membrane fusion protein (MFP) family protein n=1 Tax=Thioalkalivibrio nitratireducens (strain DSM 14787 / UNIQEM 213 / ALEN2) TaxID=1255043 RepID=L0DXG5_THIND|nr:HlyD family type I secretion periplasmic adaptor subunit [Thioalkalivibrio nitratireducens]AGA33655.1 protein secretion ABC efflux system, membrane fusion protein [Thioalkalivibrio nitratireducens DSM 14787]